MCGKVAMGSSMAACFLGAFLSAQRPSLYVNTSRTHYEVQRSQEEGEKDLTKLAQNAEKEEAWMFVRYDNGTEVWHEIGEHETPVSVLFSPARAIRKYITDARNVNHITFYHIHPVGEDRDSMYASQCLPPNEIVSFLQIVKNVKDAHPEFVENMDFRVAVSTGVYTIKARKDGIEKIASDTDTQRDVKEAALRVGWELEKIERKISKFNYKYSNAKNFAGQNTALAGMYRNGAFEVTFRPYKD